MFSDQRHVRPDRRGASQHHLELVESAPVPGLVDFEGAVDQRFDFGDSCQERGIAGRDGEPERGGSPVS
jgi:hypothetical protein